MKINRRNLFRKDEIAQLYDSAIGSQMAWRLKSTQLFAAARMIFQQAFKYKTVATKFRTIGSRTLTPKESREFEEWLQHEIAGFLLALAMENLLKALWVGKNRRRIKNIERINKQLDEICNHNLVALCKKAGFTITYFEKTFLTALTEAIFWQGRYPVPLTRMNYTKYFETNYSLNFLMEDSTQNSWPAYIDCFIQKLNEALNKIPEKDQY